MALPPPLDVVVTLRTALVVGLVVATAGTLFVTPKAIRKLVAAGIVGQDRNKSDAPLVAEMGGLAPFLAFNAAVFVILAVTNLPQVQQTLILASLVVAAGACVTGILDDLIALRQRFKAFIPFAFATPLALYAPSASIHFPVIGPVDFGVWYSILLVPLAVACASNGFNMLEGLNGLGTGFSLIVAAAISLLAMLHGNLSGLLLLFPLVGAMLGFLWFNVYPARAFPGDTGTLFSGAVLAAAAVMSKVEFWAALLFLPHILEFFLKAASGFKAQSFATRVVDRRLVHEGPIRSLTHAAMRWLPGTEPQVVARMWLLGIVYAGSIVLLSLLAAA